MNQEERIRFAFCTLLNEVLDSMDELSDKFEWRKEKEFLTSMYLLTFLGFSNSNDWRREEILKFFKTLGEELREEDLLIAQVKRILNDADIT